MQDSPATEEAVQVRRVIADHRSRVLLAGRPRHPRRRPVVRPDCGRERVRLERRSGRPQARSGRVPLASPYDARAEFNLATLRAGVTIDELRQSLADPRSVKALGQVFLEATVAPREGGHRRSAAEHHVCRGRGPGQVNGAHVLHDRRTDRRAGAEARRADPHGRLRRSRARRPCRAMVASGSRTPATALHFAIAFPLRRGRVQTARSAAPSAAPTSGPSGAWSRASPSTFRG